MQSILVSVLGKDRLGLIDDLSNIIVLFDGDWVESRMSNFESKFAGILKVNVPSKNTDALIEKLKSADLGLQITCEKIKPVKLSNFKSYSIELIGQNHLGIINKLSHVLVTKLQANIEYLKTEIIEASMSGEKLFKAEIILHLPLSVDKHRIRVELEEIADEIMVDINSYQT